MTLNNTLPSQYFRQLIGTKGNLFDYEYYSILTTSNHFKRTVYLFCLYRIVARSAVVVTSLVVITAADDILHH